MRLTLAPVVATRGVAFHLKEICKLRLSNVDCHLLVLPTLYFTGKKMWQMLYNFYSDFVQRLKLRFCVDSYGSSKTFYFLLIYKAFWKVFCPETQRVNDNEFHLLMNSNRTTLEVPGVRITLKRLFHFMAPNIIMVMLAATIHFCGATNST